MNGLVKRRKVVNRRAFLYGAGGVAIGLPFLEGMPERSAWAQGSEPIFTFFLCAACGVEPKRFWPGSTGALSGLLGSGKAEQFTLQLIANNPKTRLHSQLDVGSYSQASKIQGREPIRIHPSDAARRGIGDGVSRR